MQNCNSDASHPNMWCKTEPTINHYPLIRLFFSSHDDFCFIKMDFLKAEIIIGLTGINTKYHKHITGHRHSSQGIQQNRPDHPP